MDNNTTDYFEYCIWACDRMSLFYKIYILNKCFI